ncbi:uncharacterized protein MELLADRAFT_102984 [Melampsora larici-populina 98AG31]|uniref:Uncharacterized protein n=1 Tax=Melampsora larici-populina (strain 98AG31 / pathotype 3-4-7) TaxID=747676 RepID=F4RA63_MELLP|nr:uncharacterized protein MELLADRAFT_102984 [Melampsora larici-populina 98AG31]EGG10426.1 hypothetical protein MELLADRAFT_102984 [Melampsora larici-populina 98AG31]
MASAPDLTATMNTIITTTSETSQLRAPESGLAWHQTDTELILKSIAEAPIVSPLKAYGYITSKDMLTRNWTYSLNGAVGFIEDSGTVFIKHSSLTQSLVATVPPQQQDLAGKASISGIGKVVKVNMDNLNEDGEWHLTVHAEHDVFDPESSGHCSPDLDDSGVD